MKSLAIPVAVLLLTASPAALAQAQKASPAADASSAPPPRASRPKREPQSDPTVVSDTEIVVTGSRPRGSVIGDIKPELTLGPADVQAYGASSISELLDDLAPETSSGRGSGRPVLLINGRRISSFSELRDIPPEAIERVEILPEEVALKYGYRADQRVVNFVLREHFRAFTGEITDKVPTEGGNNDARLKGDYLRLHEGDRFNVDVEGETTSNILESERDIVPALTGLPYDVTGNVTPGPGASQITALSALTGRPVTVAGVPASGATLGAFAANAGTANVTDTTPYRTLSPRQDDGSVNAIYRHNFSDALGATVNLRVEAKHSHALLGLASGSLTVPADNLASPFGEAVTLDRYFLPGDPLQRDQNSFTSHAGITLDGNKGEWQYSLIGNFDRAVTRTDTDRGIDTSLLQLRIDRGGDPFQSFDTMYFDRLTDHAKSVSTTEELSGLLTGSPVKLPAGDVSTSLRVGFHGSDYSSRSLLAGAVTSGDIGRSIESAQLNVDVPLTDRSKDVLGFAGDLSLNGNVQVEHYSDFGTLTSVGYGAHWRPIDAIHLLVSVTHDDNAPSSEQLGDPVITTPNRRIFDYVRGTTVDVTSISGGNAALDASHRNVFKATLDVLPIKKTDLRINAEFVRERVDDPIASFPVATAAIEAAFPGRFVRDGDGMLTQVDMRPINFDRSETQQVRLGFDLSLPISSNTGRRFRKVAQAGGFSHGHGHHGGPGGEYRQHGGPNGQSDYPGSSDQHGQDNKGQNGNGSNGNDASTGQQGDKPGTASNGGQPNGSPGGQHGDTHGRPPNGPPHGGDHHGPPHGGPFGGHGGRVQFSLHDTIYLVDRIDIRPGVPVLDLLGGSATGSNGGQPRHKIELRSGIFKNGLGARLDADYNSATYVDGGATGGDMLHFSSLATFDLRFFANLGQQAELVAKHPFLRGSRVSLSVDNLFDARQRVTDANGMVPLSYQPGYVDPLGRTVRISFRKLFF